MVPDIFGTIHGDGDWTGDELRFENTIDPQAGKAITGYT
jgi:hypothetical protein